MGSKIATSHDGMVRHVARHLKQRFYQDIRARAPGFRVPERVSEGGNNGAAWLPDVTMIAKGSQLHVLEVETPETLSERQTQERWRLLARHARQRGGSLWLVVPSGFRAEAANRLQSLALEANIWEV
ncbi:MAG: hypothetical protein IH608_06390 [Proteobacteria bacterium]|nr:hypothetical protein [Pseudomonadota bacterium]